MFFLQNLNDILKRNELEPFNYESEIHEVFVEIQNNINNVTNECKEAILGNIQHIMYRLNPRFLHNSVYPPFFANNNMMELDTVLNILKNDHQNGDCSNLEKSWSKANIARPFPGIIKDQTDLAYLMNAGVNPENNKSMINNYYTLQQNNYITINNSNTNFHRIAEGYCAEASIYDESNNKSEVMTSKEVERYLGKKIVRDPIKRQSSNFPDKTREIKGSTKSLQNMVELPFEDEPTTKLHQSKKSESRINAGHSKHSSGRKENQTIKKRILQNPVSQQKPKPQYCSPRETRSINYLKFDSKYKEMVEFVDNPRRKNDYSWMKDSKSYLEKAKLLNEELNEFKSIFPNELNGCLKEESHFFMKREFPSMYEVENFYESIYLVKKRKLKIEQFICDLVDTPMNLGRNLSSNNLEISIKDVGSNTNTTNQSIVNIPVMRKIWEPSTINETQIEDLLFNIEKKFPIEEFHWTQEVVLELLMKQNYDCDKLLSMLDELNFKQAIEERASQSTDNIPLDDNLTKRLSLRRSTQTQHPGVGSFLRSKN